MRIREPKTTALIFASGKMVLLGFESFQATVSCYLGNKDLFTVMCSQVVMVLQKPGICFSDVIVLITCIHDSILSGVHRCQE
jgi:TATA-box binding protein (TBP) (component of TFIID and TFIIIB)